MRFLSIEPLLGPIPELPLDGIHWAIVGGESGPGARPMQAAWVRCIVTQETAGLAKGAVVSPSILIQRGGVERKLPQMQRRH